MKQSTAEHSNGENLTERALSGTGWSTIATVGKQLLTLASVATVMRILGPGPYGIIGMAVIVIGFIANFRDLGTASAIIQRKEVSPVLLSSLFWVNVAVGILAATLIWLTAPLVAAFFHEPLVASILKPLAISMFVASCGVVHSAILSRSMYFRAIAITDLGAAASAYIVAFTLAKLGFGAWSLAFASLSNSVVSTVGYIIGCRFRPRLHFDWSEVKSIARYSSNLSGFGIVNYCYRYADNLIVGRSLGETALGAYQTAYNLMLTPIINVSSVLVSVLMPAFSRIQTDDKRFRSAYLRASMIVGLITFPIMAGLGVVADPLIRAVLRQEWVPAIVPFQILTAVGLVQSLQTMTGIIYESKGRTDLMLRWGIAVLGVTGAAFLIGVHWGINGVAAGYAIAYLLILTVPGFAVPFRLIGLSVREYGAALLPQLLITLGMTVLCLGWEMLLSTLGVYSSWVRLISTSLLGGILYLAGLVIFRPKVLSHLDQILKKSDKAVALKLAIWMARLRLIQRPPTVYLPGDNASQTPEL